MFLFSLIKMFKGPTLFIAEGPRPVTACVSIACYLSLSLQTCYAHPCCLIPSMHIPLSLCVHTYSKYVFQALKSNLRHEHLGGTWKLLWHSVYLTSKSRGRDGSIWVSEDVSVFVSHTPHHRLSFMLHYRPFVFEIFPLTVSWKAVVVPLAPYLPSSQSPPLF